MYAVLLCMFSTGRWYKEGEMLSPFMLFSFEPDVMTLILIHFLSIGAFSVCKHHMQSYFFGYPCESESGLLHSCNILIFCPHLFHNETFEILMREWPELITGG